MNEGRTYTVEPRGKKFATVCRTDGYWSITWLSKNQKLARRKGDEFISGTRTAMRTYTTAYGRALNEAKSVRCAPMISGTGPMTKSQFAGMVAATFGVENAAGETLEPK